MWEILLQTYSEGLVKTILFVSILEKDFTVGGETLNFK
tara:strand:+ start:864 stop:977 length:114 start_codon:yes stop_codon:yes gene_type:complete